MSKVIRFLESVGGNQLSDTAYRDAVAKLAVDARHTRALLDRNSDELSELLGARRNLIFAIVAADEGETHHS